MYFALKVNKKPMNVVYVPNCKAVTMNEIGIGHTCKGIPISKSNMQRLI